MALAILLARNVAPSFKHDCAECVFLGSLDGADLYVCPADKSYVRRFSSSAPIYGSMPIDMANLTADGNVYRLAHTLAYRRKMLGKMFQSNAYRTEKGWTVGDKEPDSGSIEGACY